jgi:hypothetical protein
MKEKIKTTLSTALIAGAAIVNGIGLGAVFPIILTKGFREKNIFIDFAWSNIFKSTTLQLITGAIATFYITDKLWGTYFNNQKEKETWNITENEVIALHKVSQSFPVESLFPPSDKDLNIKPGDFSMIYNVVTKISSQHKEHSQLLSKKGGHIQQIESSNDIINAGNVIHTIMDEVCNRNSAGSAKSHKDNINNIIGFSAVASYCFFGPKALAHCI